MTAPVDELVTLVEEREWLLERLQKLENRIEVLRCELGGAALPDRPTDSERSTFDWELPPPVTQDPPKITVRSGAFDPGRAKVTVKVKRKQWDGAVVDWLRKTLQGRTLTYQEFHAAREEAGLPKVTVNRVARLHGLVHGNNRYAKYGPWRGKDA